MALFAYNTKTLRDQSLDDCKMACIEEQDFGCLSFDYNPGSQRCYLSEESSQTRPQELGPHGQADYYEKRCGSDTASGDYCKY